MGTLILATLATFLFSSQLLAAPCDSPIIVDSAGGTFVGTTAGADTMSGSCAGASGPEKVYQWTPSRSGTASIGTCGNATTFDTVLYVRDSNCLTGDELACNDDACVGAGGLGHASHIDLSVAAHHTYFIIVDGYGNTSG